MYFFCTEFVIFNQTMIYIVSTTGMREKNRCWLYFGMNDQSKKNYLQTKVTTRFSFIINIIIVSEI